jgi:hypothetical protein
MTRQARAIIQAILPSLLLSTVLNAEPKDVKIAKTGETSLQAVLAGKTVQITLDTIIVKSSEPGFPLALEAYRNEVSIVQRMTIVVGGRSLWVPRSVYADLFDAWGGVLRSENGSFVFSVGGGDGAYKYSVRVYFDPSKITKRSVFGAFASNKPLEETHYWPRPVIE